MPLVLVFRALMTFPLQIEDSIFYHEQILFYFQILLLSSQMCISWHAYVQSYLIILLGVKYLLDKKVKYEPSHKELYSHICPTSCVCILNFKNENRNGILNYISCHIFVTWYM